MTRRWVIGLVVAAVVLALAGLGYVAYRTLRPGSGPDSIAVLIDAPTADEVVAVAQPTTVHAVASGPGRVARVELWIDGEMETAVDAADPDGVSPLPLLTSWQPAEAGTHTLVVRAFDPAGARSAASRDVEVVAPDPDRDGDAVPDASDACPDEAGFASAGGCPDRDGDARADTSDACPDTAGVAAAAGCPSSAADDGDGDGTSDALERCSGLPGGGSDGCPVSSDPDGDGVPTADDRCPEATGTAAGCPDADGDGVVDLDDPCWDVAGEVGGCPGSAAEDRDGDGLPDAADGCADEPGPAENSGCPGEAPGVPEEEADSDGDGVLDSADRCPGDAGDRATLGCPSAEATDGDSDGVADVVDPCPEEPGGDGDGCPEPTEDRELTPGTGRMLMPASQRVEFEAVAMLVGDDYDGLVCYPSLGGGPVERYAFESVDGRSWQAPADLASRVLLAPPDEPLRVRMECGADVSYLDAEQPWGTYWALGSIEADHADSDWDGRVITQRSSGGDEGRWFEVQYRLCSGSCTDPVAKAVTLVRDGDRLVWSWEDVEGREVAAYAVYLDGIRIALLRGGSATGSMDVSGYEPACSASRTFTVTAVFRDGTESAPSNAVTWVGEACPRVVRVTFDHLSTYDLGNDQGSTSSAGPVYGSFSATASTSQSLSFNGLDRGDWWGEDDRGLRLASHSVYPVQGIFDRIGTWIANSMSSPYSAPERSWVTVQLGPGDDLTVGGFVGDGDQGSNPDDTLFDGRLTLPSSDVRPGTYRIVDRNVALTVLVEVIVGPEVSGDPDLALTAVEPGPEGSLNITVFNNASGMAEAGDLVVSWTDAVTGAVVDTQTWPDVQLASGATATLQTTDPVPRPGGKRYVLDPRGTLPDSNPDNNVFETPVPLRVEFVGATGAQCSEARCTILALANCEAEWSFELWVGTGSPVLALGEIAEGGATLGPRFYGEEEAGSGADDLLAPYFEIDEEGSGTGEDRLLAPYFETGEDDVGAGFTSVEWLRRMRLPAEGNLIGCDEDLGCTPAGSPAEAWNPNGTGPYRIDLEVGVGQRLFVDVTAREADSFTDDDAFAAPVSAYGSAEGWGARPDSYTVRLTPEQACDDVSDLVCDECAAGEVTATWRITRID